MRTSRLSASAPALGVLLVLTVAPLALWHRVLRDVLASFHWDVRYAVTELGPWLLLLAGVVFLVPVALSAGLTPESRFYPRGRRAYFVWGVVLYMLGSVLAVELFDLWSYAH
jgi:hypothetical protein